MYSGSKKDSEEYVQSQGSTTCCVMENIQSGGVIDCTVPTTKTATTCVDTCQTTSDPTKTGIQADQLALEAEDGSIAAPKLGDSKMKIDTRMLHWRACMGLGMRLLVALSSSPAVHVTVNACVECSM